MVALEQKYAALAPVMSLAGIFVHPIASIVLPIILFFIFYWQRQTFAGKVAIRAADLAFSMILFKFAASVLLIGVTYIQPIKESTAQMTMTMVTLVLLLYMIISLVIAAVLAFRGRAFMYILSLRIAERVLDNFTKKPDTNNPKK